MVDVDTSAAGFTRAPTYVAAVAGDGATAGVTGGSAVYDPTANGFRVYLHRWNATSALTAEQARAAGWHVTWSGYES